MGNGKELPRYLNSSMKRINEEGERAREREREVDREGRKESGYIYDPNRDG